MKHDEFRTYLIRYRFKGADWQLELPAQSLDEAEARLMSLRHASVDGELVLKIPANTGPIASILVAIRNRLQARKTDRPHRQIP